MFPWLSFAAQSGVTAAWCNEKCGAEMERVNPCTTPAFNKNKSKVAHLREGRLGFLVIPPDRLPLKTGPELLRDFSPPSTWSNR